MSIVVELSEEEIITCRLIGNLRSISSRLNKVNDARMGDQSSYATDEVGAIGEYAFCKHFNIFFDPSIKVRSGSYDCLYKGKRIDIKTTEYAKGRLVATKKINPDVDIFVLAVLDIEKNVVAFPGYALASELYQDSNMTDLGHGTCYAMDAHKLRKWKQGE